MTKYDIIIFDLTHTYDNEKYIFKNVNMSFKNDQISAIIGKSGEGKTTICNLILKLWEPTHGEIRIDNFNINNFDTWDLRKSITYISQDTFLINDSIYNNILLDCKDVDDFKFEYATKMANLSQFINNLPDKHQTIVGDKGMNLSGGQRQRIAIARAIIRDTPIVIFDEPTSALDHITEKEIIENFKKIFKGKTIIIITHKLSIAKECDIIYLLENENAKIIDKSDL